MNVDAPAVSSIPLTDLVVVLSWVRSRARVRVLTWFHSSISNSGTIDDVSLIPLTDLLHLASKSSIPLTDLVVVLRWFYKDVSFEAPLQFVFLPGLTLQLILL